MWNWISKKEPEGHCPRSPARNAGARGLRAIIEGIMKNVMYEVPSRDNVEKCIVTADVVTKHKDPKLLLKQEDNDTRKNA